jgi:manganese/iron transport system ATP-binding protein
VLLNRTVLAYGPTVEIFTQANLERTFGGVLRHFVLNDSEGGRPRALDVITDDERAVIFRDGKPARHEPDDRDRD